MFVRLDMCILALVRKDNHMCTLWMTFINSILRGDWRLENAPYTRAK